jgi:acetyltransferase-like isoleucine patch superfamily enzyme
LEHGLIFKFDGPYTPGEHIVVGDHVFIGTGVEFNIKERVSIGKGTLIASGCRFIDHDHGIQAEFPINTQDGPAGEISIGSDCWIGVNAVILKSVSIGNGAVIGAGAVVNKSVPPGEIWAGVPARRIGSRARASQVCEELLT